MSVFKSAVERWRPIVMHELAVADSTVAANYVLSVIQQESGGKVGVTAYTKAGDGSYARGLMQCIGSVTADYNRAHGTDYDHVSVMGGKTDFAGSIQIRVGLWLLRRKQKQVASWCAAHGAVLGERDRTMLADTAYAMGWGALRGKLEQLEAEGRPLSFDALAERFPRWGYSTTKERWINRPIHHAETVWNRYQAATEAGPEPVDGGPSGAAPFLAVAVLAAAALVIVLLARRG